jgi:hypothetical protein
MARTIRTTPRPVNSRLVGPRAGLGCGTRSIIGLARFVAAVRKDWPGSAIFQPLTQLGAVIGLVAEALRCWGDEPFRGTVIRFASGQEDGEKAAAGTFVLRPPLSPFFPAGERCAVACGESIIRVLADLPSPAVPGTNFPRLRAAPGAQIGCRLSSVGHRPGNHTRDSRFSTHAQCRR